MSIVVKEHEPGLTLGWLGLALRRWWPIFVIVGLMLGFCWPLICRIPLGQAYMAEGDFINQVYPYHHFVSSEWWKARIPLWNPFMLGGHPFQADPQSAVMYPVFHKLCDQLHLGRPLAARRFDGGGA